MSITNYTELKAAIASWLARASSPRTQMADFRDVFSPPDRGQATKKWPEAVDAAHPDDVKALRECPPIKDIITRFHDTDAGLHNTQGPTGQDIGVVRDALQHLRCTAVSDEDWINTVREAYRKNPNAFPAVLLPLVLGAGAYDAAVRKD